MPQPVRLNWTIRFRRTRREPDLVLRIHTASQVEGAGYQVEGYAKPSASGSIALAVATEESSLIPVAG